MVELHPEFKRTESTERMEELNQKLMQLLLQNCSIKGQLTDVLKITPQGNGLPQPPVQLVYDKSKPVIILPKPEDRKVKSTDLRYAIEKRRSIRNYSEKKLTMEELAWLLWATQGVQNMEVSEKRTRVLKNVPSGGSLPPFETYLIINKVEGLEPGLYRYLSVSHELVQLRRESNLQDIVSDYCGSQSWMKNSALIFLWTFIPYRSIWRYSWGACKLFLEVGHICQNLYLSAEAVDCGVCAIGAFDLERMHNLLEIDGFDEILVYIATVGKRV